MTLLLIDIGNTRVKWARLRNDKMTKQQAAANADWTANDYARIIGRGWTQSAATATADRALPARLRAGSERRPSNAEIHAGAARRSSDVGADMQTANRVISRRGSHTGVTGASTDPADPMSAHRIIVASVAGDEVNQALTKAAAQAGAPPPEFVTSERTAAGITTDYIDPWRLGVDRFVAAIGAHHLSSRNPVCVVSIGTAMTVDLVDGSGRHRGGAIVPGPALMVSSLLTQTNGIRRRATGGPNGAAGMFAKTTRNAIGEGARYAAAGVIDRALEEARFLVGTKPLVLLTGGAAADIKPLIRSTCVSLPDLVLHGLAVWAHQTPPQTHRKRRPLV